MTPVPDGEIIGTALGGATIAMVTTRIVGGVPDVATVHTGMAHGVLITAATVVIHLAVGSMIGRSIRAGMMSKHLTIIVKTHDHVTFPPLPYVGYMRL